MCHKGYFRFWCQKVLPLVYDESLSYYELLCKVVNYLNEVMKDLDEMSEKVNNLETIIDEWLDNLDIIDIIENKIDELFASGAFDNLFRQNPPTLKGDVTMDIFTTKRMQGCCYIGNNEIALYCAPESSNTGTLYKLNISTKDLVTSRDIEAYHGNTLTFDIKNRKIYICGEQAYDDTATVIPQVIVVDADTFNVDSVIVAPINLYSLAYDNAHEVFYGISSKGTVSGEANRLYKLNKTLTTVVSYVDLENFPPVTRGMSGQGLPLVVNNTIYNVLYNGAPSIQGYDPETGKMIFDSAMESMLNNYRFLGELQSIIYDYDNNEYYIGAVISNNGEAGIRLSYIAKINLFHDIIVRTLLGSNYSHYTGDSRGYMSLKVYMGRWNHYRPATHGEDFNCVMDAINYSKSLGIPAHIDVVGGDLAFTGYITGFCGWIRFLDTPQNVRALEIKNSKIVLRNMNFNGSGAITAEGYTAQLIAQDSDVTIRNCSFTPIANNDACMVINRGSVVIRDDPTYDTTSSVPLVKLINAEIHCCFLGDIKTEFDVTDYPLIRGRLLLHKGEVSTTPSNISSPITPRPTLSNLEVNVISSSLIYSGRGNWHNNNITAMIRRLNSVIFPSFTLDNGTIALDGAYPVLNLTDGTWSTSSDPLETRIFLIP